MVNLTKTVPPYLQLLPTISVAFWLWREKQNR